MIGLQRKSLRLVAAVIIAYTTLCATHAGEFWPFSIYQMFSSAGKPWSRSIVTAADSDTPEEGLWQPVSVDALPGELVPLDQYGVNQNDLAGFLEKTQSWAEERIGDLEALFARNPEQGNNLIVYRVLGELVDGDSVLIEARPVLLIAADTTYLNPVLAESVP